MSRYIDADLLQAQIERGAEMTEKGIRLLDLSQQPTADVEPVVHAHWIDNCDEWTGDSRYTCSKCGTDWTFIDGTPADNDCLYCLHCGARMDGGKDTDGR